MKKTNNTSGNELKYRHVFEGVLKTDTKLKEFIHNLLDVKLIFKKQ